MEKISNEVNKMEMIIFNMSSYSEWERGIINRNFHLLNKMLKCQEIDRVVAIDFLPFNFKRALRNYWQNIIKGPRGTIIYRDLTTRCVKISKEGQAELFVFSSIDSIFSSTKVVNKLNKILSIIDRQTSALRRIVWSCFPMFVDYFSTKNKDGIKADLTVFDAVDNWIEHPSFKNYKKRLKENYQIISQKSDLIFVVSDNLLAFFKSFGRQKDLYWISNGVDNEHFRQSIIKPNDLKKIPRPIIGYVGIIQQRLDIDLLDYLAQKNPDKSFVLIGPLWPVYFRHWRRPAVEIKRLKKHRNVYLLGARPYALTPAYIKSFDVAISPHKLDSFIKSTNSLKILEYLACGRPVVTTPTSGAERFSHLVYIAIDYEDFDKKINQALLKTNDVKLRQQMAEQMEQQDWSIKFKEIMKIIKNKLNE